MCQEQCKVAIHIILKNDRLTKEILKFCWLDTLQNIDAVKMTPKLSRVLHKGKLNPSFPIKI